MVGYELLAEPQRDFSAEEAAGQLRAVGADRRGASGTEAEPLSSAWTGPGRALAQSRRLDARQHLGSESPEPLHHVVAVATEPVVEPDVLGVQGSS